MTTDVSSQDKAKKASQPGRVEHLSEAERVARGKAARGEVPAPCMRPGSRLLIGRARWSSGGAGADAGAGAGADPLRADAGLAVHVLPWCRLPDGIRPLGAAEDGLHAQLCGDAHLSNFGALRGARPAACVQHQRLRRDTSGPVRVGCEAAGRQLRGCGSRPRLRRQAAEAVNLAVGPAYREAMARYAGMGNLELWYTRVDVEELFGELQHARPRRSRSGRSRTSPRRRSKDSLKAFAKLTELVDGEPRIAADPPVVTPLEELARRGARTRPTSSCAT